MWVLLPLFKYHVARYRLKLLYREIFQSFKYSSWLLKRFPQGDIYLDEFTTPQGLVSGWQVKTPDLTEYIGSSSVTPQRQTCLNQVCRDRMPVYDDIMRSKHMGSQVIRGFHGVHGSRTQEAVDLKMNLPAQGASGPLTSHGNGCANETIMSIYCPEVSSSLDGIWMSQH